MSSTTLQLHINHLVITLATLWAACALHCCSSSKRQGGWSVPWGPGPMNMMLHLADWRWPHRLLPDLPVTDILAVFQQQHTSDRQGSSKGLQMTNWQMAASALCSRESSSAVTHHFLPMVMHGSGSASLDDSMDGASKQVISWKDTEPLLHLQILRGSRSLPPSIRNHKFPAFCHHRNLHFPNWYAQTACSSVGTSASWNCRVSEKFQWNSCDLLCCTICWPPTISPSASDTHPQLVHHLLLP